MKRNGDNWKDLWGYIESTNICIIGVPEEVWDKGSEDMFENITKGFCDLGKEAVTQVQKAGDPLAQDEPSGPHKGTL